MAIVEAVIKLLSALAPLVSALAWPIAAIVIARVFQWPLSLLIPTLNELKYKDLSAKFGRRTEELASRRPAQLALPMPSETKSVLPQPSEAKRDEIRELVDASPRAAILEAWLTVENALFDLLERKNLLRTAGRVSIRRGFELLVRNELVKSDLLEFALSAYRLRNEAVHLENFEPANDDAEMYVDLIFSLGQVLRSVE